MKKKLNVMSVVLIGIIVIYILYYEFNKVGTLSMETVSPVATIIEKKVILPGVIQASKEVDVKSIVSGVVEKLFVEVGNKVKKGDPLVQIRMIADPVEYQKLQKRSEISLAQFENTKKLYERYANLLKNKVVAKSEYDEVEKQFKIAKADLQSIQIELSMLNGVGVKNIGNIIKATSDGTILELPIKLGGAVMARGSFNEGTTIAKLANLESLCFIGYVSEVDVRYLSSKIPIKLSISALPDRTFNATLNFIAPKGKLIDGVAQYEINARVRVPNDLLHLIRDGYSANAEFVVLKKRVPLALDEKYIQFSADSVFVELLTSDNTVKKQLIETGVSDGIRTEILTGISANSKIIPPNFEQKK